MFEIYVVETNGTERLFNTFRDGRLAQILVDYLNKTDEKYYFIRETE